MFSLLYHVCRSPPLISRYLNRRFCRYDCRFRCCCRRRRLTSPLSFHWQPNCCQNGFKGKSLFVFNKYLEKIIWNGYYNFGIVCGVYMNSIFFFENMTTFCLACLHDCKRVNEFFVFFSFIRLLIYGCVLIILIAQCIFIIKAQCKCVVCFWMWMWESLDLYNNWPTCVRHHILACK